MKYSKLTQPTQKQIIQIEKLIQSLPEQIYFQSILFFNACQATPLLTPYYYVASDGEKIVGFLLAFRQVQYRLFPLNFLSSRNIIWGGPLVLDDSAQVYEGLYEIYRREQPIGIYTQVRNLFDQSKHQELMKQLGFQYEEHLNIIIDLSKSEQQLWQEVDSKRRNEIRRAIKEGTTVEVANERNSLEECYLILKEVYQRAKLPLPPLKHFESLWHYNNERKGLKLFVAKFEGKIIGCMMCLAYGDTLFDYYAGAYSTYYQKYPNDLIPWEVFKWGKENNFTKFDFGGAGKPNVPYGVRDYKKKFGGTMVNYGRFEKIHFPILYRIVTWGFNLRKTLIK